MMSTAELLGPGVKATQDAVVKVTEGLSEQELRSSPGPSAPPIAFQLWHIARWTDRLQSRLSAVPALEPKLGRASEIWDRDRLASRWGFAEQLGYGSTGMELPDADAARLTFPPKEQLFDYIRATFAAAARAVSVIDDDLARAEGTDLYDKSATVDTMLLRHLSHVNRHLGMIEAMRGVIGLRGTATR